MTTKKNKVKPGAAPQKQGVSGRSAFPIVGVGASAGGLEALKELLENMPENTGMGFVVVTHQHPGHTSLLPELLSKYSKMPVAEATDGMRVELNHVYVGSPGGYLAILHGNLHRMESGKGEAPKLPIDYFFRSLAEDQKEKAICIVLSGTGTDGTLGLKAIKGDSGMAMVEQPQFAKYAGMPSSAIATGLADYVLPPASMPKQLMAYAKGPYLKGAAIAAESPAVPAEPMQMIFLQLHSRTGHDFSAYKSNTLRRRIERRMNLHEIKEPSQYVRYLHENPLEIDTLFQELLISVTNFFRDPEAWEALGPALDDLVESRPENDSLRVWVPGCATGEEAYSIAIALRDRMEKFKRYINVQIFGTDLDSNGIQTARLGQYPDGIAVDVPPNYLERYFTRNEGVYQISSEIREMAIFAQQNVIADPPFTKLDILSCRNLLIYLNAEMQKNLLQIFHYALKPNGLLFLGSSETIGTFTDLFEPIDKRWKIFRRKESAAAIHALAQIPTRIAARGIDPSNVEMDPPQPLFRPAPVLTQIERLLLGRFAPISIVANERGEIYYIHGRSGRYLEPSSGKPRNNVLEMAREGLQIELSSAMHECVANNAEITRENLRVKTNGDYGYLDLKVAKLNEPESLRDLLLITLRPTQGSSPKSPAKKKTKRESARDDERADQLARELQYLKESHQTTLEELETSNEELKTTNEELQSTNEELQSTNEELETSKEEMQSLNEELTTVNAELQSKLDDLSQANDDMQNLLNSTKIATVFLDNELNIKRFTEQAKDLVMLRPTDIGRPILELASNLEYDNLFADCQNVLKTLVYKETELRTKDGLWYLMRIMPYRTADNVIDGIVLTFTEIGELKKAENALSIARVYFEGIVDTVREPLVVLDANLIVVSANRSFYRDFMTGSKDTVGTSIYALGSGQWNIEKLRDLLENILPKDSRFEDYEVEVKLPKLGPRSYLLNARRLEQPQDSGDLILMAFEDVTDDKQSPPGKPA